MSARLFISKTTNGKALQFILLGLFLILLVACASQSPHPSPKTPSPTSSPAPSIQITTSPTSSPNLTAPNRPVPATFSTEALRAGISPTSYIDDSCQYLALRWDPEKSIPGTVISPIMFHSIRPYGEEAGEPSAINRGTFDAIVQLAEKLGFETITSQELVAFLQGNAKIPPRAMLLILDDRRPGTAEDYFLPVLETNNWTATLSWPIGDTDSRTGLWEWMERLNETGYFDIQSHGLNHIYLKDAMPESQVREEIFGSIPILKEHFGARPIAYVWPGGNYTVLGVELAQEAGFQLGFTVHSRGPTMFNWVPQGEQEGLIGQPLMLLPRYWSSAALLNLQQAAAIGDEARTFAIENYPAEAAWFRENCGSELASLSEIFKDN